MLQINVLSASYKFEYVHEVWNLAKQQGSGNSLQWTSVDRMTATIANEEDLTYLQLKFPLNEDRIHLTSSSQFNLCNSILSQMQIQANCISSTKIANTLQNQLQGLTQK